MTKGVAADLSHVETRAQVSNYPLWYVHTLFFPSYGQVSGFEGADQLEEALQGCELVLIPAGVPRKPGLYWTYTVTI